MSKERTIMDIGLTLPQEGLAPTEIPEVASAAERAGFASLWAYDRLLAPVAPRSPYPASADGSLPEAMQRVLDPVVAVSVAAAATSTIRLGTSVLVAPWYAPVALARAAASLDVASGGRFTLGLGVGWSVDEYEAAGVPMAGRGRRLDEILDVATAAWADPVVALATSRERVAPSVIGLKPAGGRVPVLLAAYTPDGLDRVARRADGWIPAGIPLEAVAGLWQGVHRAAERYGRDPDGLRLVVLGQVNITDRLGSGRPDFVGSVEQVRSDIDRCAELGVDEVIVGLGLSGIPASRFVEVAGEIARPVPAGV